MPIPYEPYYFVTVDAQDGANMTTIPGSVPLGEVSEHIRLFLQRYEQQGYYRNARQEMIELEELQFRLECDRDHENGQGNEYQPRSVPPEILTAILANERKRIGVPPDEYIGFADHPAANYAAYFPRYVTSSPGYAGPVVVIVWEATPRAVSIFVIQDEQWVLCNQMQQ